MKIAHRIVPRNDMERQQVKAIEVASVILEESLQVSIQLCAQRQPGWAGTRAYHAGMYQHDKDQTVKINFRNLSGCSTKTVLTVLGHEFRHAVQHQKVGFWNPKHSWRWIGPVYAGDNRIARGRFSAAYYARPEEVDARFFQATYASKVMADPRFAPFMSSLDIEGEVIRKPDLEATFIKYGIADEDVQLFDDCEGHTYYLCLSQVEGRSWTERVRKSGWTTYRALLLTQPFEYVMVPCTLEDFVC